jgi:hypothetical protein
MLDRELDWDCSYTSGGLRCFDFIQVLIRTISKSNVQPFVFSYVLSNTVWPESSTPSRVKKAPLRLTSASTFIRTVQKQIRVLIIPSVNLQGAAPVAVSHDGFADADGDDIVQPCVIWTAGLEEEVQM